MATTPPPYADITGIYTTDDKHQAISRADYDGSAKPGQLVVDTADYSLWVGDDTGALNPVGGGGGGIATALVDGDGSVAMDGSDLEILNTDDDILISTQNGGDDINIYAGDDIRIYGGDKDYDLASEGGWVSIQSGDGSSGDAQNGGNGGDVEIIAGQGGSSNSGVPGLGGYVEIRGGFSFRTATTGGEVLIHGGNSTDNLYGPVEIGLTNQWIFNENTRYVKCPLATLTQLGPASAVPGARAMINDSTVAASGNFGAIAAGGSNNTVPVFSDGTDWLIG